MGNCFGAASPAPISSPPPAEVRSPKETVQPTHLTSTPSSTGPYHESPVASSSQSSRKPAHHTAQHDDEITSPKIVSHRYPSSGSGRSLQRNRSMTMKGTTSSGSGHSPQRNRSMSMKGTTSAGSGHSQRSRSVTMTGTTSPQGVDSRPSGRMTAVSLTGPRRPPGSTQFGPGQAPETGQMSAERHEGPRFPSTLQSLLPRDFRFSILVAGKRVSGKSSLLSAVFKVDMSGAPINVSGITSEFRLRDNRHLIAHECSAFGPGDFQAIRDFITIRNHKSRPASERLHAIWICVPMSDAIDGQFDESVKLLLGVGVPLVLVFTKFDLIASDYETARATAYTHCRSLFGNVPAEIVSTQPNFRNLIEKLVTTTDTAITTRSRKTSVSSNSRRTNPRMSPVTLAWSVSQRASRDVNIQATIEVGRSRYWRSLWNSDDFAGQTLANCVEVIHADIVGVWNFPDKDRYLSSTAFQFAISYLVQDLSGPLVSTSSRHKQNSSQGTGAAWLNNLYENGNENICLVVGYIVDLTLILCGVFYSTDNVSRSQVQSVMNNFASSNLKMSVHAEISRFIRTVPSFNYHEVDVVMEKSIDLIRQYCEPAMLTYK